MNSHPNHDDVDVLTAIASLLRQQQDLCDGALSVATSNDLRHSIATWSLESREMLRQVECELAGQSPATQASSLLVAADIVSMRMRARFRGPDRAALASLMRGRSRLLKAIGRRLGDAGLGSRTRTLLQRLSHQGPLASDSRRDSRGP